MPMYLEPSGHAIVEAACERLIPAVEGHPGGAALGCADYIDGLLGAFLVDPPRDLGRWPVLGPLRRRRVIRSVHSPVALEELAWRTRIEGSQGLAEREFNGPVIGWQEQLPRRHRSRWATTSARCRRRRAGRAASTPSARSRRCSTSTRAKARTARRSTAATATWRAGARSQFPGDVQPRGYTDDEVQPVVTDA